MPYPMTIPQYSMLPTMMAKGGYVNDARAVQAQGRGKDTMLVHMTPKEVAGLQALARSRGGSLSINPDTGLPEAGFLDNLLPTILGIALTPVMGPMAAGLTVGGIETVRTGDLGKGLLAGLGAYGGANLAGSLTQTGAATAASAAPGVTEAVASGSLPQTAASFAPSAAPTVGETAFQASFAPTGTSAGGSLLAANPVTAASTMGATVPTGYTAMGEGIRALGTEAGRDAFLNASGGYMGLAQDVGMAAAPSMFAMPKPPEMPKEEESDYEGPYKPSERRVSYPGEEERRRTSEFTYFTPSNPIPYAEGGETSSSAPASTFPDVMVSPNEARVYQDIINVQRLAGLPALDPNRFFVTPGRSYEQYVYNPIEGATPIGTTGEKDYGIKPLMTKEDIEKAEKEAKPKESSGRLRRFGLIGSSEYAKGGSVPKLEDGGFVLTKKAVDGLGSGSNKKGQKVASRGLGAIPIKGPGTGTSDSIPTTIDGKRPALISNGEAYVPKRQVAKKGGAKAFYALMNKAEKAADRRKRA